MHIYVVRMHALIHMCRVLHNKTFFQKNPLWFCQRASKIFNDEMTRKITPSNLTGWDFWTFQEIWSHKIEKGSRVVKLDMASKRPREWESLKVDTKRCKKRFPKWRNSDQLSKREKDYWWSRFTKKVCILERWHWSVYRAKFGQPLWTRKIKERFVWMVTSRRHAAKV